MASPNWVNHRNLVPRDARSPPNCGLHTEVWTDLWKRVEEEAEHEGPTSAALAPAEHPRTRGAVPDTCRRSRDSCARPPPNRSRAPPRGSQRSKPRSRYKDLRAEEADLQLVVAELAYDGVNTYRQRRDEVGEKIRIVDSDTHAAEPSERGPQ